MEASHTCEAFNFLMAYCLAEIRCAKTAGSRLAHWPWLVDHRNKITKILSPKRTQNKEQEQAACCCKTALPHAGVYTPPPFLLSASILCRLHAKHSIVISFSAP